MSKTILVKKIHVPETLGQKNFGQKKVKSKKVVVEKNVVQKTKAQINLGPKKFWVENFLLKRSGSKKAPSDFATLQEGQNH